MKKWVRGLIAGIKLVSTLAGTAFGVIKTSLILTGKKKTDSPSAPMVTGAVGALFSNFVVVYRTRFRPMITREPRQVSSVKIPRDIRWQYNLGKVLLVSNAVFASFFNYLSGLTLFGLPTDFCRGVSDRCPLDKNQGWNQALIQTGGGFLAVASFIVFVYLKYPKVKKNLIQYLNNEWKDWPAKVKMLAVLLRITPTPLYVLFTTGSSLEAVNQNIFKKLGMGFPSQLITALTYYSLLTSLLDNWINTVPAMNRLVNKRASYLLQMLEFLPDEKKWHDCVRRNYKLDALIQSYGVLGMSIYMLGAGALNPLTITPSVILSILNVFSEYTLNIDIEEDEIFHIFEALETKLPKLAPDDRKKAEAAINGFAKATSNGTVVRTHEAQAAPDEVEDKQADLEAAVVHTEARLAPDENEPASWNAEKKGTYRLLLETIRSEEKELKSKRYIARSTQQERLLLKQALQHEVFDTSTLKYDATHNTTAAPVDNHFVLDSPATTRMQQNGIRKEDEIKGKGGDSVLQAQRMSMVSTKNTYDLTMFAQDHTDDMMVDADSVVERNKTYETIEIAEHFTLAMSAN